MTLRDELEVMLAKMYYSYSLIRDKERKRRWAVNMVTMLTAFFFVLGMFFIRQQYGAQVTVSESWLHRPLPIYFPMIAFVIWAGFIGGFMSLLVRLVNLPTKGDEDTLLSEFETVIKTLYSGPIIGAVFALLLYLAIAAQLLTGSFFPEMESHAVTKAAAASDKPVVKPPLEIKGAPVSKVTTPPPTVKNPSTQPVDPAKKEPPVYPLGDLHDNELNKINKDLKQLLPVDGKNLALLLVWCFIAGYAQTFVPDKLKAITNKASKSGS